MNFQLECARLQCPSRRILDVIARKVSTCWAQQYRTKRLAYTSSLHGDNAFAVISFHSLQKMHEGLPMPGDKLYYSFCSTGPSAGQRAYSLLYSFSLSRGFSRLSRLFRGCFTYRAFLLMPPRSPIVSIRLYS